MKIKMLFVLLITLLNCQQAKVNNDDSTGQGKSADCLKGEEEARKDIQEKILGLYLFGLPNPRLNARIDILKQYQITIKGGGDIITEDGECYNAVMEKKIEEKYGKDFFSLIDKKVDSLYSTGLGDRDVEFPGGRQALTKFIACNLDYSVINKNDQSPVVYISLVIDSSGVVKQANVAKGINNKIDSEALRVSRALTGWIPAIQKQKKADSKVTIQVKFDPAEKAKAGCN